MFSYLFGFSKRFLLYQFFFIFAYMKMRDIAASSYEFKDKFYELTSLVNFKHAQVEQFLANPIFAFQVFIGVQTVFALLALLGSRLFSFLAGLCLVLTNALYFNPLKLAPGAKKTTPDALHPFGIDLKTLPLEFILMVVLALGVFTQAVKPRYSCVRIEEEEEIVQETPEVRREKNKPSSKKRI